MLLLSYIDVKRTKIMTFNQSHDVKITKRDNTELEAVDEFTYPGSQFSRYLKENSSCMGRLQQPPRK